MVLATRLTKTGKVLAALTAASFALAACSNGASGSGGGGGGNADLSVGVLIPLTGELASWGKDWETNYEIAAKEINNSGLLPNGGKVKLHVEDEGGSAEVAVRAAQKLVDVDGAQVIVGPTSLSMVALNSVATKNHIPIISPAAGTVRLDATGGTWLFRTYPSDSSEGVAMGQFLIDNGLKRISIMVQNEESAQGIVKVLTKRYEGQGGDIVQRVDFDGSQSSYQAQVAQAIRGNPDLVYLAGGEESARTIIGEIRRSGYSGRIAVNGDLTSPGFLKEVGAKFMDGVCGGTATPTTTTAMYKDWAQKFTAAAHKAPYVTQANAYDSMIVVALAAVAGGKTTGQSIRDNLRKVAGPPGKVVTSFKDGATALKNGSDIDYNGASGIVDFDKSGTSPTPFSISCVKNGDWAHVKTYTNKDLAS